MEPNLTDSLAVSALTVWVLQKAKESERVGLRWIQEGNPALLRVLAGVGATLTAAGFSWDFDTSTYVLTVGGLSPHNLAAFIWLATKQYIAQWGIYKTVFKE